MRETFRWGTLIGQSREKPLTEAQVAPRKTGELRSERLARENGLNFPRVEPELEISSVLGTHTY